MWRLPRFTDSNVRVTERSECLSDVLLLLSEFNGSFVDVSRCFSAHFECVLTAIRRLDLNTAATLLQRAVANSNNVAYSSTSSLNNTRKERPLKLIKNKFKT